MEKKRIVMRGEGIGQYREWKVKYVIYLCEQVFMKSITLYNVYMLLIFKELYRLHIGNWLPRFGEFNLITWPLQSGRGRQKIEKKMCLERRKRDRETGGVSLPSLPLRVRGARSQGWRRSLKAENNPWWHSETRSLSSAATGDWILPTPEWLQRVFSLDFQLGNVDFLKLWLLAQLDHCQTLTYWTEVLGECCFKILDLRYLIKTAVGNVYAKQFRISVPFPLMLAFSFSANPEYFPVFSHLLLSTRKVHREGSVLQGIGRGLGRRQRNQLGGCWLFKPRERMALRNTVALGITKRMNQRSN